MRRRDRMRQIAASAELRQRLGARGVQTVARELSPAAIAPIVRTRIDAIANGGEAGLTRSRTESTKINSPRHANRCRARGVDDRSACKGRNRSA